MRLSCLAGSPSRSMHNRRAPSTTPRAFLVDTFTVLLRLRLLTHAHRLGMTSPACRYLSLVASLLILAISSAAGAPAVPAMFVFGDSLVDPGNNNRLVTLAKANYAPNGVDFPGGGATGRFCNGRTVVDHLGELLGLPLIPPFNNPTGAGGQQMLHGVNYASAASGILNDTGNLFGGLFPMQEQVRNLEKTVRELESQMGGGAAAELLKRSLFFVGMGSNDYLNNYLRPFSSKPREYTPEAYTQILIQHYREQLKDLYRVGGRRFLIAGLGPLGCIPNQIVHSGAGAVCVNRTNGLSLLFNSNLKLMLQELNNGSQLSGSRFLFWDTYSTTMDVISNSSHYGFRFPYTACCGDQGGWKSKMGCLAPRLPLPLQFYYYCGNRSEYVFWDPYHPTDAFNAIAARQVFEGSLQRGEPMNVRQLVR